jgi:hypothetical protein
MLRGCRLALIAAFGWLILAASPVHKQDAAASNQAQPNSETAEALRNIASAIEEANKRPEPDAGCQPGQDDRRSDLCAQWKAADAASDSAWWTKSTFWLAIVGTLIGGGTLGAASYAAWYAKRAAEHTETGAIEAKRAANAAEETLSETRTANATSLRPYVVFTVVEEEDKSPFTRQTELKYMVKNFGQTPATNVRLSLGDMFAAEPFGTLVVPIGEKFGDFGLLAPGDFRKDSIDAKDLEPSDIGRVFGKEEKLIVRLRVDYSWPGGTDFHDVTMCLDDPSTNDWHLVDERRRQQGGKP